MLKALTICCTLALATPVQAAGTFTYADFERSVGHINLAECPEGLAEGEVFCRVSMHDDALHVFVFSQDGDQPFVSVHTFYEDDLNIDFGG